MAKRKRAKFPKYENLHVCHERFQENCFQRDMRVSYIFLIGCLLAKYVLKPISTTMHFTLILT